MDETVDRVLGLDLDVEHRARAVRMVASAAQDAGDCRSLAFRLPARRTAAYVSSTPSDEPEKF